MTCRPSAFPGCTANHYIVSMVNPDCHPFIPQEGSRSAIGSALGLRSVWDELLNFYRGLARRATTGRASIFDEQRPAP